jgi:hypothetical protein
MESPKSKDGRTLIALDEILSQIMRGLARAEPCEVQEYLSKAHWLYWNVDRDLFLDESSSGAAIDSVSEQSGADA